MRRVFLATIAFLCFVSHAVLGKIYIDITSPASSKVGVALSITGLPLEDFDSVLRRDLMVYGIFALYPLYQYHLTLEELRLIGADVLLEVDKSVLGSSVKIAYKVVDITDGSTIRSDTLQGTLKEQVELAHTIADALYSAITGSKGMFHRKAVAFRRVVNGYELVLVDVGAMKYRVLAFFSQPAQSPVLSPDGKSIAFSRMVNGDFDIYLYHLDTGKMEKVCSTPCPDTAPSWMPDGRKLVFSGCLKGDNPDILVCDVKKRKVIARITRSIAIDTSPSVSPDGKRIAFVSNREGAPHVYVADVPSRAVYRVTRGRYDVSPDWSPRGNEIAFASSVGVGFMIGVCDLDTQAVKYLFSGEEPAWSPNGDYILYTKGSGLYISSVYGTEEIRLFVGKWINPSWR